MYIAIYEFKVKKEKIDQFKKNWQIVTDAIYEHCGSLGSRLHKSKDELTYIAYAQWPSKEIYENNDGHDHFTDQQQSARADMLGACEDIQTLHLLEVTDDRLQNKV